MKYLIAGDIHGSAHYTRKLVECIDQEKPDRIILLGDILYHGPRNDLPEGYAPKEVAAMLNTFSDISLGVKGNCEADIDQKMLGFPMMAPYILMELNGHTVFFTHGDIYNLDNHPSLKAGDIIVHGHTHVPCIASKDEIICLNPGSVSIPKENSYNGYILLEDDRFIWKDFSGNIYNTYKVE